MNKLVLFLAGISAIACTEISYKEPQPAGVKPLTTIPSKFHGKYLSDKDTVVFFENGLRGKDKGKEEVLFLSDSIVLKEYKSHYFVSYRDGNVWLLRILMRKKNGDLYLLEMENVPEDETQKKEFLSNLSKEIPVIESESHYIIEPSPKKLYSLIKKGYFKEQEKPWMKKIE
ncbi:MAG TPA: hypothetical protein VGK39_07960 [Cyclobacteriaceae bacterium]